MRTRGLQPQLKHGNNEKTTEGSRRDRQIVRVLALLRVLAQGNAPTVHELAAHFRTRRETIYRDLRVLEDAGYPVVGDERGRLSRPRLIASATPEIRFSRSELEALLLAAAQTQTALPTSQSLSSATTKLRAIAESSAGSFTAGVDQFFETWAYGSKDYRAHEGMIVQIIEAILRKRRCRVQYRRPSLREPKTYEFDPYRLLYVGGGLYVLGRVPTHSGTVTLAIDRLLSVDLSKTVFDVDPTFDPQECRLNAFGVSWHDPIDVVLRFRPDQAPYIRERMWHPSQKLTDLPDGYLQLAFRAGGPFELRRWVLGWGDAVEVVSPDELRDEIRKVLNSAISIYRDSE
jgi:proteasome accessory factor B